MVFTHLHPDHAFFVRSKNELRKDVEAYTPENSEELETVKVIDQPFEKKGFRITPIPVIHSLKVKSYKLSFSAFVFI